MLAGARQTTELRVLLVDDEIGDVAASVEEHLAGIVVERHVVSNEDQLRGLLEEDWLAVIVSWGLRGIAVARILEVVRAASADVPCIIAAPRGISVDGVVLAMRAGAHDVVAPENMVRLRKVVERAIRQAESERSVRTARSAIVEARKTARAMAQALGGIGVPNGDGFFRWVMETGNVGVWVIDDAGETTFVNARMAQMLRCTPREMIGRRVLDFVDERDHEEMWRRHARFARGESIVGQVRYRRTDGTHFDALLESTPLLDDGGVLSGGLAVVMDITSWREAEEGRRLSEARCEEIEAQLRQAQKMEAVGQLAGGIAHDFNNMLSVILGYSDGLLERVSGMSDIREDIEEIMTAGRRASELTRQLLMFSRQHVMQPTIVDLGELVQGMRKMIERIVGEDIEIAYPREVSSAPLVKVDRSSIEQVLLNLVVNARDAMPTGGKLTIAVLERAETIVVRVQDNGCGMDAATIARAFDPFFTTKEQGKGTGLGLATVYGIVEQAGGTIRIESALGAGASFEMSLPRAVRTPGLASTEPILSAKPSMRATILLVEDEDQVRAVARRALERQGHRVLEARSPLEALDRNVTGVDLLLTDVIMPQMSGTELARRLTDAHPTLKVLFMSGYNDDNVVRHGIVMGSVAYLEKPFTPADLSKKVREVLEQEPASLTGAA